MKTLKQVTLKGTYAPTGKTKHLLGARPADVPSQLKIVQFDDDPGYYLLYCDERGHEITDTYHDSLQGALEQASWEFSVPHDAWKTLSEN